MYECRDTWLPCSRCEDRSCVGVLMFALPLAMLMLSRKVCGVVTSHSKAPD